MILLFTALAGGIGGAARFTVDTWVSRRNHLSVPIGTVVVNLTACLLLGFLTGMVANHVDWQPIKQVLGVGLLGGYSTFSTASIEGARLMRQKRYLASLVHSGGMLIISIIAAILGLALGSLI